MAINRSQDNNTLWIVSYEFEYDFIDGGITQINNQGKRLKIAKNTTLKSDSHFLSSKKFSSNFGFVYPLMWRRHSIVLSRYIYIYIYKIVDHWKSWIVIAALDRTIVLWRRRIVEPSRSISWQSSAGILCQRRSTNNFVSDPRHNDHNSGQDGLHFPQHCVTRPQSLT